MKIFGFLIIFLLCAKADVWRSNDGRELEAEGLNWLEGGVLLKRADNKEIVGIKYEELVYEDILKALSDLDYYVNDKVSAYSKTVSTKSVKLDRQTGRYHLFAHLHTYDGYHYSGTGKLTPITKKVRLSGRVVEVNLSSPLRGDGIAGVEFYALSGSGSAKPSIYHAESGVIAFLKNGSPTYFSAPIKENFKGWVVLVRSPNTGEIIEINSSLRHLEKYVLEAVPEVAKFKVDTSQIKKEVLEREKARHKLRVGKSIGGKPQGNLAKKLERRLEREVSKSPKPKVPPRVLFPVYRTTIEEDVENVLKLDNGGIVKINSGYLGYVGFRRDSVLFRDGLEWKIWIEGKKAYKCDILKAPIKRPSGNGERITILEIQQNGKILRTLFDKIYAVSALNTIETAIWVNLQFEALLIDGTQLINLDRGNELVEVRRVK